MHVVHIGFKKVKLFFYVALLLTLFGCSQAPQLDAGTKPADPVVPPPTLFEATRSSSYQLNVATDQLIQAVSAGRSLREATKDAGVRDALASMEKFLNAAGETLSDFAAIPSEEATKADQKEQAERKAKTIAASNKALESIGHASTILQRLGDGGDKTTFGKLAEHIETAGESIRGAIQALEAAR